MKTPVPLGLRLKVQRCSINLRDSVRPILRSKGPWPGSQLVFWGTYRIRTWGPTDVSNTALNSGSMVVYPGRGRKRGGFIEIDHSNASEDRGFFAVDPATFDRALAVVLAHMTGHQAALELHFALLNYSPQRTKVRLSHLSLSYGEKMYFGEEPS